MAYIQISSRSDCYLTCLERFYIKLESKNSNFEEIEEV